MAKEAYRAASIRRNAPKESGSADRRGGESGRAYQHRSRWRPLENNRGMKA